jgi:hypothetical protein
MATELRTPLQPDCHRCGKPGELRYEPGCTYAACGCPDIALGELSRPDWQPGAVRTAWLLRAMRAKGQTNLLTANPRAPAPAPAAPPVVHRGCSLDS